ncbi:MAG: metallophosphoesterase [Planctomycetes bacterium]|nr:metallophosphoesterase [Planctomycetota bacterium]
MALHTRRKLALALPLLLVPAALFAWYCQGRVAGGLGAGREGGSLASRARETPVGPIPDFDFAVVSDLHFGASDEADTVERVRAIPLLAGAALPTGGILGRPDFVLTCGDNTENGEVADAEAEYGAFKTAMDSIDLPYYYANGNHDVDGDPAATRGLRREPYAHGKPYYTFEHKGLAFIVLNYYTDEGSDSPAAELDDGEREWFEAELLRIGVSRPIVLVIHPLPERWEWLDMPSWIAMTPGEADYLAETIEGFNVVAILCGHFHPQHVEAWHGIPVVDVGRWGERRRMCVVAGRVEDGTLSFISYTKEALHAPRDEAPPLGKILVGRRPLVRE